MKTHYIYANPNHKIEQTQDIDLDYKEQIKTVCVILYNLVGQGVGIKFSEYLANRFKVDKQEMENAFFDFVQSNLD